MPLLPCYVYRLIIFDPNVSMLRCGDEWCSECDVGETCQSIQARTTQHRRNSQTWLQKEAQNSAVFLHPKDAGHTFKTKDVVVLDKEARYTRGRGQSNQQLTRKEDPAPSCCLARETGHAVKFRVLSHMTYPTCYHLQ